MPEFWGAIVHEPQPEADPSRWCNHYPDLDSVEADDSYDNKTMYVADCRECMRFIKTEYTEQQPENADWVGFRD